MDKYYGEMMEPEQENPTNTKLILPVGTQVVTVTELRSRSGESLRRSGSVGKIISSPKDNQQAYLIQFPDGTESQLFRHEIAIRKHIQNLQFDRPGALLGDRDLYIYIIYRCIVGSRAYGLDIEDSDVDKRGIYLPPASLHWSLYGLPEQIEDAEAQECYFELQKFLVLALKANPNILECLYTPLVELAEPIARELLEGRDRFLSKLVYQTYNGYVMSQFKKLEQDMRTQGKLKWKHVMHLIRLLISGVVILKENFVPVLSTEYRERLLSIRRGEISWEEINEWRLQLHKDFDQAYENSKLPERPDYEWANQLLIRAREQMTSK
ncbi:MAG: nucleotidyltransferase domain-containing protein [Candidatus Obscuribacterales bacterium]|nr:nucleotidyltransferase domain-containing protein [Candidatus Obscuribacterales bacterium]